MRIYPRYRAAKAAQRLPDWLREEMLRRGLDPARPLNDVDLGNQSVVDAIMMDPTLSPEEKQRVLQTGSPRQGDVNLVDEVDTTELTTGIADNPEYPAGEQNSNADGAERMSPLMRHEGAQDPPEQQFWNGLSLVIENPSGSIREGTDEDGHHWEIELKDHYGFIKNTEGEDEEGVDVFINPDAPEHFDNVSGQVFIVHQTVDGKYDEDKVMIGYAGADEAEQAYLRNYEKGWDGFGEMTEMTDHDFLNDYIRDHWKAKGKYKKDAQLSVDPELVYEALSASLHPSVHLSFVPEVVNFLVRHGMTVEAAQRALIAGAHAGVIELQPESGLNRLTPEQLRLCPPGPQGTVLSWARQLQDRTAGDVVDINTQLFRRVRDALYDQLCQKNRAICKHGVQALYCPECHAVDMKWFVRERDAVRAKYGLPPVGTYSKQAQVEFKPGDEVEFANSPDRIGVIQHLPARIIAGIVHYPVRWRWTEDEIESRRAQGYPTDEQSGTVGWIPGDVLQFASVSMTAELLNTLNDLSNNVGEQVQPHATQDDASHDENTAEDVDLHMGSLKTAQVEAPYSDGQGPLGTEFEEGDDERKVVHASGPGNIVRLLGYSPEAAAAFVQAGRPISFALAKVYKMLYPGQGATPEKIMAWCEGRPMYEDPPRNGDEWIRILNKNPQQLSAIVNKYAGDDVDELYNQVMDNLPVQPLPDSQTVHSFEDKWRWVKLHPDQYETEGDLMSHCGDPSGGPDMYSLRDPKGRPHVTYSPGISGMNYEMRGRGNTTPHAKYQQYIAPILRQTLGIESLEDLDNLIKQYHQSLDQPSNQAEDDVAYEERWVKYLESERAKMAKKQIKLGRGLDPYKVGRIYRYDELLPQHQEEIRINRDGLGRDYRKYMWLRAAMPLWQLIDESNYWYDRNFNKKWRQADRNKAIALAEKIDKGATLTPLMVSPPGEENGGLWEGYHRLRALEILMTDDAPVIMKIDPGDPIWQLRVADFAREPWVCVDFDGTIANDEGKGGAVDLAQAKPFPGVAEAMKAMLDHGYRISIYTARDPGPNSGTEWEDDLKAWLKQWKVPYTDIYNADCTKDVGGKPPADVFVDNQAVNFGGDWARTLQHVDQLVESHRTAGILGIDDDKPDSYTNGDETRDDLAIPRGESTEGLVTQTARRR